METQHPFELFLQEKGIDPAAFRLHEPQRHGQILEFFVASGAKSTDHAKKFLWNELRRTYPWRPSL